MTPTGTDGIGFGVNFATTRKSELGLSIMPTLFEVDQYILFEPILSKGNSFYSSPFEARTEDAGLARFFSGCSF